MSRFTLLLFIFRVSPSNLVSPWRASPWLDCAFSFASSRFVCWCCCEVILAFRSLQIQNCCDWTLLVLFFGWSVLSLKLILKLNVLSKSLTLGLIFTLFFSRVSDFNVTVSGQLILNLGYYRSSYA